MQADEDIAAFEFGRSRGHQESYDDWESLGIPAYADGERVWQAAAAGENTTPLFLGNASARTATLGILRLRGDWDAAKNMQEAIIGADSPFFEDPYRAKLIDRDSPESKRLIMVDAGITSVYGLTTVSSRRRLLQTQRFTEQLGVDGDSKHFTMEAHIEVDKVSTFALDIKKLDSIDPQAANEVRLIIICGILAEADIVRVHNAAMGGTSSRDYMPAGLKKRQIEAAKIMRARLKMEEYGVPADDVMERLETEYMTHVQLPQTREALEAEIAHPTGLLLPSTVTYYGERVMHSLSRS